MRIGVRIFLMRQEGRLARNPGLGGLAARVVVRGMALSEVPVLVGHVVVAVARATINYNINAGAVNGAEFVTAKRDEYIPVVDLAKVGFAIEEEVIVPVQLAIDDGESAGIVTAVGVARAGTANESSNRLTALVPQSAFLCGSVRSNLQYDKSVGRKVRGTGYTRCSAGRRGACAASSSSSGSGASPGRGA
ncbi:hypothetical protein NPX13_g2032 [Xylaria arbuscula]|uniref:Uncharacterized protein n=1 Tax=Xylaria arbuscula TaxID=114810 RepID=A0A9W8NL74_9PEZI|nr:hypothetical protein NPX13_g2032 [Xylaria arbuscula]